MAQNYFAIAAPRVSQNALIDFSPVSNALEDYGRRRERDMERARLAEAQQYQRGRDQRQDARADVEWFGKQAAAIDRLEGPQREAAWKGLVARHPNATSLTPDYLDPGKGPAMVAAEAGLYRNPLEDEKHRIALQTARLGLREKQESLRANADLNAILGLGGGRGSGPATMVPPAPAQNVTVGQGGVGRFAAPMVGQSADDGLPPEIRTQAAMALQAGDRKEAAKIIQEYASKTAVNASASRNISAGLNNLKGVANKFDDTSFESALGPWQGTDPDNVVSGALVSAARLVGDIGNSVGGGKTSTAEVRDTIRGSARALAMAIKPLVRKPGEGTWTDADQAQLNAIVGDLANASNKEEYRRRLNGVRDRIRDNFGLSIDFESGAKVAPASAAIDPATVPVGNVFEYKGHRLRALGNGQFEKVD